MTQTKDLSIYLNYPEEKLSLFVQENSGGGGSGVTSVDGQTGDVDLATTTTIVDLESTIATNTTAISDLSTAVISETFDIQPITGSLSIGANKALRLSAVNPDTLDIGNHAFDLVLLSLNTSKKVYVDDPTDTKNELLTLGSPTVTGLLSDIATLQTQVASLVEKTTISQVELLSTTLISFDSTEGLVDIAFDSNVDTGTGLTSTLTNITATKNMNIDIIGIADVVQNSGGGSDSLAVYLYVDGAQAGVPQISDITDNSAVTFKFVAPSQSITAGSVISLKAECLTVGVIDMSRLRVIVRQNILG